MQETAIMNIETRTKISKGENKLLRRNGYLPGIIFGKGEKSIPIAVKKDEFRKSLKEYGRNAVFKLVTQEESYTVMAKEIQVAPIINEYCHVDFQRVSLSEEIKADVFLKVIGAEYLESKRLLLYRQVDVIPVSGLPQDIPDVIEIDVSNMKSGENMVFRDLKLPEGISSDIDPEQVILSASESRVQEVALEEDIA